MEIFHAIFNTSSLHKEYPFNFLNAFIYFYIRLANEMSMRTNSHLSFPASYKTCCPIVRKFPQNRIASERRLPRVTSVKLLLGSLNQSD